MKNRTIKFRAWDGEMMITDGFLIRPWDGSLIRESVVNLLDYPLMRFTGLTDKKNGREIYEGDIVSYHTGMAEHAGEFANTRHVGRVRYIAPSFYIQNDKHGFNASWKDESLKIIGNIYENPELLDTLSTG